VAAKSALLRVELVLRWRAKSNCQETVKWPMAHSCSRFGGMTSVRHAKYLARKMPMNWKPGKTEVWNMKSPACKLGDEVILPRPVGDEDQELYVYVVEKVEDTTTTKSKVTARPDRQLPRTRNVLAEPGSALEDELFDRLDSLSGDREPLRRMRPTAAAQLAEIEANPELAATAS
jgi:hypothetical protein